MDMTLLVRIFQSDFTTFTKQIKSENKENISLVTDSGLQQKHLLSSYDRNYFLRTLTIFLRQIKLFYLSSYRWMQELDL